MCLQDWNSNLNKIRELHLIIYHNNKLMQSVNQLTMVLLLIPWINTKTRQIIKTKLQINQLIIMEDIKTMRGISLLKVLPLKQILNIISLKVFHQNLQYKILLNLNKIIITMIWIKKYIQSNKSILNLLIFNNK